jgi:predicted nucleotide-binding protein
MGKRVDPDLMARLMASLKLSRRRVYELIQETSAQGHVPIHIGALMLAQTKGISIVRFAKDEDYAVMRGAGALQRGREPQVALQATVAPAGNNRGRAVKKATKRTVENTVFVVHGRDAALTDSMYALLRAVGLQPQEWSQAIKSAGGGNPYVKDVVRNIMERAQAIVVILSPDDEAKLQDHFLGNGERAKEGMLRGQARPNVLFEMGIALGAHPKKTVIVKVGDTKTCSDIEGMHIPSLNDSAASRKGFVERLRKFGCKVDLSGDAWLSVGKFIPAKPTPRKRRALKTKKAFR